MYKLLAVLIAVFTWCHDPLSAFAQPDTVAIASTPENPPQILIAESIDDEDRLVLVSYHSIFIGFKGESYNERLTTKVSLENVEILTVEGTRVSLAEARKRIAKQETPILATSYKQPVPKFFAGMFAPQTLQFVFPSRSPKWKPIEAPSETLGN